MLLPDVKIANSVVANVSVTYGPTYFWLMCDSRFPPLIWEEEVFGFLESALPTCLVQTETTCLESNNDLCSKICLISVTS